MPSAYLTWPLMRTKLQATLSQSNRSANQTFNFWVTLWVSKESQTHRSANLTGWTLCYFKELNSRRELMLNSIANLPVLYIHFPKKMSPPPQKKIKDEYSCMWKLINTDAFHVIDGPVHVFCQSCNHFSMVTVGTDINYIFCTDTTTGSCFITVGVDVWLVLVWVFDQCRCIVCTYLFIFFWGEGVIDQCGCKWC